MHNLIRGTSNRDKHGHELTYRGAFPNHTKIFKSIDQRTEMDSLKDRTDGLVEGSEEGGYILTTNYDEIVQYKLGEAVVPPVPRR